jgi:tetratricopeptide (TPR) repeat protein
MKSTKLSIIFVIAVLMLAAHALAAPSGKKTSAEDLKQYAEDLKTHPGDKALREKIIKIATGMKTLPATPEDAERNMARGTAFAQKAADAAGYKKAITEFEAASNSAPWLALAYYNMGVMQEKAGLFNEAIQSLKFYLLADTDAKNAREVKNKIYALEAEAEAVQAGMNTSAPETPSVGKLPVAGGPSLEIEPEKQLRIIKMPQEKKAKMLNFVGNWYFKENIRDEDVTIHAFEIQKNPGGDLTIIPPKRAADSHAAVNIFEIADKNLKLQMKWRMKSVVGYWKTETYVLTMSGDGTKLTGAHNQQSVGGRNIDMDRTLFRQ